HGSLVYRTCLRTCWDSAGYCKLTGLWLRQALHRFGKKTWTFSAGTPEYCCRPEPLPAAAGDNPTVSESECGRSGIVEVSKHLWFEGFNWGGVKVAQSQAAASAAVPLRRRSGTGLCIAAGSAFAAGHGLGCGWPLILPSCRGPTPAVFDFLDSMNRYAIQYSIVGACVFAASALQVALCLRRALRRCACSGAGAPDADSCSFRQAAELTTRLADDLEKIRDGIGDKPVGAGGGRFLLRVLIGFFKRAGAHDALVMMSLTPLLAIGGGLLGRLISSISSREAGGLRQGWRDSRGERSAA
uniref:ABC transmembrane type-1 domain-containing protein n=1 Tax=Macrostomum lignano TaxID=282301 RepID=A0A1I8JS44_9PLAT